MYINDFVDPRPPFTVRYLFCSKNEPQNSIVSEINVEKAVVKRGLESESWPNEISNASAM